jgi:hypothetical protein
MISKTCWKNDIHSFFLLILKSDQLSFSSQVHVKKYQTRYLFVDTEKDNKIFALKQESMISKLLHFLIMMFVDYYSLFI